MCKCKICKRGITCEDCKEDDQVRGGLRHKCSHSYARHSVYCMDKDAKQKATEEQAINEQQIKKLDIMIAKYKAIEERRDIRLRMQQLTGTLEEIYSIETLKSEGKISMMGFIEIRK